MRLTGLMILIVCISSCRHEEKPLFTELNPGETKVDFINHVEDSDSLNILDYMYFYNGGGVAVGDINNDSLPDIFFTANNGLNKLYLNKGGWQFEDITVSAGGLATPSWTTGVTMVDINADGYLDLYVSVVGDHRATTGTDKNKIFFKDASNKLFINDGQLHFKEQSVEYGVDIKGYNTQAAFFDADNDGDLDLFQLQHSVHQTEVYGDTSLRNRYSDRSGGKLYLNENGKFHDRTKGSGIISSALGYGLGVAIADFNNDGWDDIYVGNDFHENDYYYINTGGKFKEKSHDAFAHHSNFSMGNDFADLDHNGWMDIITLDMLPADEKVLKASMGDRPLDIYKNQYAQGYNYQNARNCLQLNVGEGERFSDIGLYSGVAATDWSWSPLLADFDLDGNIDLFVTNGIKSRLNDLDYIKFLSGNSFRSQTVSNRSYDREILEHQPPGQWHNYFFKGTDSLKFIDRSREDGFEKTGISNGAAYADLDNDGDLDLVLNNFNATASVIRNNISAQPGQLTGMDKRNPSANNWLKISIRSASLNTYGIGAKAILYAGGNKYYQQLQPTRGFMSSVEPVMHFATGEYNQADSLVIILKGNRFKVITGLPMNQHLYIDSKQVNDSSVNTGLYFQEKSKEEYFTDVTIQSGINFIHHENDFDDFNRQWFIPHQLSKLGPALAVGDVNGDGLEDIFMGGAKSQASVIYVQDEGGKFIKVISPAIASDSLSEDVDAVFFDADKDGDQDLYVVSGGYEFRDGHPAMADRLYINDGKGTFSKALLTLPSTQKSCIAINDIDKDGDMDIFLGGLTDAMNYGVVPPSYLLMNDGKGRFEDVLKQSASQPLNASLEKSSREPYYNPTLFAFGMIRDAAWIDIDDDSYDDLVVVGEWMDPLLFRNAKGRLTNPKKLIDKKGWWQSVEAADINQDGRKDLVLGNYGRNSKLEPGIAGKEKESGPLRLFIMDPDKNRSYDQVLAIKKNGDYYPFLSKEDLERQLPYLKKKFLSYNEMAGKTMTEIFGEAINDATILEAESFASMIMMSEGKKGYSLVELPFYQQLSPLFATIVDDFNKDTRMDIFVAGNFSGVMPYEGKYDAMLPSLGFQQKDGRIKYQWPVERALRINGDIRKMKKIRVNNKEAIIMARNNEAAVLLQYQD